MYKPKQTDEDLTNNIGDTYCIDYALKKHRMLFKYSNNRPFSSTDHVYEFTLTFNPKWFSSNDDMSEFLPEIIKQMMIKGCSPIAPFTDYYLEYVVEYQSNGAPHIHATYIFKNRLKVSTQTNWEQFFQRMYGKTVIYYTGNKDKIHHNDHFDGPWSKYLLKDNPENYVQLSVNKNY